MLVDIYRLPGIADPDIPRSPRSQVSILGQHILRQLSFLLFVLILFRVSGTPQTSALSRGITHMQNEYREYRPLPFTTQFLSCKLNVLL
jgi:hypothetical protein